MTTNNQGVGTRELALIILLEIERGEKSHIVLRQVLEKYQYLSKQDRAFLTRLAEGTTERRIELDYIINQFSKVKTEKISCAVRSIRSNTWIRFRIRQHAMKQSTLLPGKALRTCGDL